MIYVTSERLRWRWSKSAHVAVNGEVKYYVDGRKLHIEDDDGKEHTVEILKEIRRNSAIEAKAASFTSPVAPLPQTSPTASVTSTPSQQVATASVAIESVPGGADIEIDGNFVGNTPSTVQVSLGEHSVFVKKKGFADWSRKLNITGGSVHLTAELDQK